MAVYEQHGVRSVLHDGQTETLGGGLDKPFPSWRIWVLWMVGVDCGRCKTAGTGCGRRSRCLRNLLSAKRCRICIPGAPKKGWACLALRVLPVKPACLDQETHHERAPSQQRHFSARHMQPKKPQRRIVQRAVRRLRGATNVLGGTN